MMGKPAMTRAHFQFIADVIADVPDEFVRGQMARRFANQLPRTNSGFDSARFIRACGGEG